MDRNALAELLQALESRRDAEERRREERYTALIERVGLAVAAATTPTTTPLISAPFLNGRLPFNPWNKVSGQVVQGTLFPLLSALTGSAHRYHPRTDSGAAKTNTRCTPKSVPSADRIFTHCRLTMQPPRATVSEDNAALGSLQASPQAPGQTTGVTGARAAGRGQQSSNNRLSVMAVTRGVKNEYMGLLSGASSKGAPRGVQDVPYSLEIAGSSPGYSTADRGQVFPAGGAQLAERRPGREDLGWPGCPRLTAHQRPLYWLGTYRPALKNEYMGLLSGASSKGAPCGVQDTPYSLEIAGSSPGYSTADRGQVFPAGGAQLAERRPGCRRGPTFSLWVQSGPQASQGEGGPSQPAD
ncbi:UNVERIFIED_CONTAM: hypothetical protein FKN15_019042 [Acipenser sinensis]